MSFLSRFFIKIFNERAKIVFCFLLLFNMILFFAICFLKPNISNEIRKINLLKNSLVETKNVKLFEAKSVASPLEIKKFLKILFNDESGVKLFDFKKLTTEKVGNLMEGKFSITLYGSYSAIVGYLSSLDALPYLLFWHKLDYSVSDYPYGKVVVTIGILY